METSTSRERPLPLWANPWAWLSAAIGCGFIALVWMRLTLEEDPSPLRILLIAASMLFAGIAVAMRLSSSRPSFLDDLPISKKTALRLIAAGAFAFILAVFFLAILKAVGADLPWSGGALFLLAILSLLIVGAVGLAAVNGIARPEAFGKTAESGAVLVFAGLVCMSATWAMYIDAEHVPTWRNMQAHHVAEGTGPGRHDEAKDWDTLRLFTTVVGFAAIVGAFLAMVPFQVRCAVVSLMIVFHYAGITSAILTPNPMPWIIGQVRARIFEPYLGFVFLENAYQFYAPDPGPSNHFWLRVEYRTPDDRRHWRWVKFPDFDDQTGSPKYLLPLQYYRRVAMCDQMAVTSNITPPMMVWDKNGQMVMNPIYDWRVRYSLTNRAEVVGGVPNYGRRDDVPVIPFHTDVLWNRQYRALEPYAHKLLQSLVQYICRQKHPDHPDAEVVSAKVYHVIHFWPTTKQFRDGIRATHPALYFPYYQGKYDPRGKLLDEPIFEYDEHGRLVDGNLGANQDPFYRWLLPILMEKPTTPNDTLILGWVFIHAESDRYVGADLYRNAKWVMYYRRNPVWREPLPDDAARFLKALGK